MTATHVAQLRVLLWKNWLFSVRSKRATSVQLLAPMVFTFLLRLLQILPSGLVDVEHPKTEGIGVVPKCKPWNGHSCTTLLVGTVVEIAPFVKWNSCMQKVTEGVAAASGLKLGQDIQIWNNESDANIINSTIQYLLHKPNQTAHVLLFGTYAVENSTGLSFERWCHIDKQNPERSSISYIIMYNGTRQLFISQLYLSQGSHPDGRNELQLLVDQVFMRLVLGRDVKMKARARDFPVVHTHESLSREGSAAIIFFYCGLTFQFVMLLHNIVIEKDLKLRQGLKLIGMRDSMYWMAWFISGVFVAALAVASMLATGYACNLLFFTNTSFIVNFIILMVYSCSLIPLAFLASAAIRTLSRAVTVGILFYIVGLFLVIIVSNPFVGALLYNFAVVPPIIPRILSLSPAFSVARLFAGVNKAFTPYNMDGYRQETFRYTWSHLFTHSKVKQFSKEKVHGDVYYLPPAINSIYWMLATSAVYGVIFWYLDKVFPGEQGIPEKWYFPFQLSYWIDLHHIQIWRSNTALRSRPGLLLSETNSNENGNGSELRQLCPRPSLILDGLEKSFSKSSCCVFRKKRSVQVVDGLSIEVSNGELLVLLGHNGAGKSTTINMLTGLLWPDQGDAYIHNVSIRTDMRRIRSFLGVCPQHDLLWDDLTAWEHVELFASMKGMSSSAAKLAIVDILRAVQLDKVMDHHVSSFSGGMKRRLSVALSLVGDPKVVFLDEPTTGMDPCVRRKVWNLILSAKKDRVIVMTTHSMEEADVLGDHIAIMAKGSLVAYGSSVALKNQYAGYDISLVVKEEECGTLQSLVGDLLASATLREEPQPVEGGVLHVYNVPPENMTDISPFIKAVQERASSYLVDFSVSQTTLEDVFVNVTRANVREVGSLRR